MFNLALGRNLKAIVISFMPFPSILTCIIAVMCAGLPELGLLGKESRLPELDQNGYEHRAHSHFCSKCAV